MDAQNRHQRHFHVDRDWKYPCIAEVCSEAIGGLGGSKIVFCKQAPKIHAGIFGTCSCFGKGGKRKQGGWVFVTVVSDQSNRFLV